jgi:YD repeat-containing protein
MTTAKNTNKTTTKAKLAYLLASAAMIAAAIVAPAYAQEGTDQIGLVPTNQSISSPGGVNMKTGEYNYQSVDAQIGGEGEFGGISLIRSIRSGFRNDYPIRSVLVPTGTFNHNWQITINENLVHLKSIAYASIGIRPADYNHRFSRHQPDYRLQIEWGSRTETFDWARSSGGLGQASAPETPISYIFRNNVERSGPVVYTYQATDGTKVIFRPMGFECGSTTKRCAKASAVIAPDGTKFDLSYETSITTSGVPFQRLASVISNKGYGLKLFYNTNEYSQIASACLVNLAYTPLPISQECASKGTRKITYSYQGNYRDGVSFTATKPGGIEERISYLPASEENPAKMLIYRNGDTSPYLINSLLGESTVVTKQEFANGQTYDYSFNRIFFDTKFRYAGGTVTDSDNNVMIVDFEQVRQLSSNPPSNVDDGEGCGRACYQPPVFLISSGPTSVTDQLGRTSVMDYCDPQIATLSGNDGGGCLYYLLQSITDPEGRRLEYTYNLNKQVVVERRTIAKPGSNDPDIVEQSEYLCTLPICFVKPTATIDASGNRTDYEYAAEHGGLVKIQGPVIDGNRSESRYSYMQLYAWTKAQNGGYIKAATPVWVLQSEQTCNNANFDNCGPLNLVTTTYQYEIGNPSKGSNILLLGTAVTAANSAGQSETLRSCVRYDALGRKISETQPLGTGSICP